MKKNSPHSIQGENQLNPFLVFDVSLPIKLHASVPVLSNKVLFVESESPF